MISQLYNTLLFQPLLNLLVFFYNVSGDIGLAIILLTILVKLILLPISHRSIKSQKALQQLQPKLDAVKKQYKNDREGQAKAMMELYKNEKVNPLSSCLPLLVQLPFLLAIYQVFWRGLGDVDLGLLYSFVANPIHLNPVTLGLLDLSKPNIPLAILAGLAQFWQARMMVTRRPAVKTPGAKDEDMMAMMNKQMVYFMPLITVFIGISLPGGLVLYWFVVTMLSALQQLWVFRTPATGGPTPPATTTPALPTGQPQA